MGDFLNQVVVFLEDYYVYVIGVGLIIILMLIGFLSSKKKEKVKVDKNEAMVNINEVDTGSITDVASTLQGSNVMQPVDVVTFNDENTPSIPTDPVAEEEVLEVFDNANTESNPVVSEPIVSEAPSFISVEEVKPVESVPFTAEPIVSEAPSFITPSLEPVMPMPAIEEAVAAEPEKTDEDKFEKTEVIDFSALKANEPIAEIKPTNFEPFVVDKSQYAKSEDILNGENSPIENNNNL